MQELLPAEASASRPEASVSLAVSGRRRAVHWRPSGPAWRPDQPHPRREAGRVPWREVGPGGLVISVPLPNIYLWYVLPGLRLEETKRAWARIEPTKLLPAGLKLN